MALEYFSLCLSTVLRTLPWLVLFEVLRYCAGKVYLFLRLKSVPHRKSNILLGDIVYFKKDDPNEPDYRTRMRILKKYYDEFYEKKLVVFWRLWQPMVMIYDPRGIADILALKAPLPKGRDHRFILAWIGEGLLESVGEKWHSRRKLLTPAFHFKILEEFVPVIIDHTKKELEKWGRGAHPKVNLNQVSADFTLAVLFETAMGLSAESLAEYRHQYLEAVERMTLLTLLRYTSFLAQFDCTYYLTEKGREYKRHVKLLHEFTEKAIEMRLIHLAETKEKKSGSKVVNQEQENVYLKGKKERRCLMDTLLECYLDQDQKQKLSLNDIRDEVDTFMFAGHDTTATTIMWALFILGNHPEVQEKLFEELSSCFDASGENFNYHELMSHKYLDACVKECMRLVTPVPVISKTLVEDTNVCGHRIPKSSTVVLQLFFMHRDPLLYPDPIKFDPNRFMNEEPSSRSAFSYVPFSAGPRNCIGQKYALLEVKIFIALMVLQYKFKSLKTLDDIEYSFEIVTRAKQELEIECTRRV